ncbi:50S ribosomal protein L35, chloroplastic [Nymphaea colorata]|nr:50S ribosomal protein L35, chloroplastic [Nymphaea colorata]
MACMATATMASSLSCKLPATTTNFHCVRFPRLTRIASVSKLPSISTRQLSSSKTASVGFSHFVSKTKILASPLVCQPSQSLAVVTVVAAKGYKMKTHKASAKRFRVTGNGKIMRRRAGKQHLLAKKNTKRKNRLSKMQQVSRSDYNNVIGALPYLKVNRAN